MSKSNLLPSNDVNVSYLKTKQEASGASAFLDSLSDAVQRIGNAAIGGVDTFARVRASLNQSRTVADGTIDPTYNETFLNNKPAVQTMLVIGGMVAAAVGILLLMRK